MFDVAIEYHVYRVFYYKVGQGAQFGAVVKFERSDRVVLGSIPTGSLPVTLLFFFCQLLSTMLCMCSLRAPVPPECYYNYFLRVSSVNFSPGCVH